MKNYDNKIEFGIYLGRYYLLNDENSEKCEYAVVSTINLKIIDYNKITSLFGEIKTESELIDAINDNITDFLVNNLTKIFMDFIENETCINSILKYKLFISNTLKRKVNDRLFDFGLNLIEISDIKFNNACLK